MATVEVWPPNPQGEVLTVSLYLESYSANKEGKIFLTSKMTEPEIDDTVKCLIGQIEKAGAKAKKILRRAKRNNQRGIT